MGTKVLTDDIRIITTPPKVFAVGVTRPIEQGFQEYLEHIGAVWNTPDPIDTDPVTLIESGGRICYGSWHNPKGSAREQYTQGSIIGAEHFSVLRHLWFNFIIADLSRDIQLELVRHAVGTAPSFESQRFTDKRLRFVAPPGIRDNLTLLARFAERCRQIAGWYFEEESLLRDRFKTEYPDNPTLRRKRAKEAARSILPNAAGSDGQYSMNAQAVRWISALRTSEHAAQSIRELAYQFYTKAKELAPAVFLDGVEEAIEGQAPVVHFEHL